MAIYQCPHPQPRCLEPREKEIKLVFCISRWEPAFHSLPISTTVYNLAVNSPYLTAYAISNTVIEMVRLSLTLLATTLLQTGTSLGFPTGFSGGVHPTSTEFAPVPAGFPQHHRPQPMGTQQQHPIGEAYLPQRSKLPVTPEWLRWLPFDMINM
ncbi:hypothetical protein HD806DRAFT_414880 [Xylariaceae sp. AK1471]|nr:hypothetical protein HD806DRAFT_414880 [Xylariaceae sp. AK1471]